MSDSGGYIYDEAGINDQKLTFIMDLKNVRRGRISEYADKFKSAVYTPFDPNLDHNPLWNHKAQCAFPSATQNEINGKDAANMLRERRLRRLRRRQHADHDRGRESIPRGRRFSTVRAKPPTPGASPPPASRWRKTACAFPGRATKWIAGCRRS